ncbi:mechanosensitive ion channel [Exiguobacterium flavidum]|uniref:mechanosensitive ion channel n=1 Tax=Exiguobacterium flavidum TaxID=2184695 RepID=UPI000DF857C6|nr:mechanosensitive ion channel [Exiguobacterium flavidum]
MRNWWNGTTIDTGGILNDVGNLLLAIVVFLIGWLVAKLIANGIQKALEKSGVVHKLSPQKEGAPPPKKKKWTPEKIIATVIFWILMIFVLILVFNILNLAIIAGPLADTMETLLGAIPNILQAGLILLLAYILAVVLRAVIVKLGNKLMQSERVRSSKFMKDQQGMTQYPKIAGDIVFYLILLMFLPGVLGALNIESVSEPFSGLLSSFLAFIPRLIAAALIFIIGYIVAKIVRDIVTNFLHAIGTDKFLARFNVSAEDKEDSKSISSIIGTVVFILILIPVTISALDQLNIKGISQPAINMLNDVLGMIPNIVVGVLLILVGVYVGRFVKKFVTDLLSRLGFNNLTKHLKIGNWDAKQSSISPSSLVGSLVEIVIIVLFVVEAFNLIGLDFMVDLGRAVLAFLPIVLTAIVILAVGIIVANLVKRMMDGLFGHSELSILSNVAKYAILALTVFMALGQLGVAATIVNAAFVLILGAVALAFGLAFGLGGRDNASRYLDKLEKKAEATEVNTVNLPKSTPSMPKQDLKSAAKGAAQKAADDVTPDSKPSSSTGSSETTHGTPKGALPENDLAQKDDYPLKPDAPQEGPNLDHPMDRPDDLNRP